jgi:hypothetical protein
MVHGVDYESNIGLLPFHGLYRTASKSFCGMTQSFAMGSSTHGAEAASAIHLKIRTLEMALIFRRCVCVMAKRLRDVCALPESEPLRRAGRGFVVRALP